MKLDVPAFLGLMPSMILSTSIALTAILNVSLATKAIMAGTISPTILVEAYVFLIVVAGASVYLCAKIFGREGTIFRGSRLLANWSPPLKVGSTCLAS